MKRLIVGLAAVAVLVSMGQLRSASAEVLPDAGLFGEPIPVPGRTYAGRVSLNPEGNRMVYHWGGPSVLYEAELIGGTWTNITALSLGSGGGGWESWSTHSPDGNWLFYDASDGVPWFSGGAFDDFIYRSIKQPNGEWGPGEPLPGDIHDFVGAVGGMFYDDELYVYKPTNSEQADLYVSEYDSETDTFGYPTSTPFDNINDGSNNRAPTRIGNTLLLQSDRDGTYDIWMSEWDDDNMEWGTPIKPDWPINTDTHDESGPWYHEASQTLYFERNGLAYQSQAVPAPSTLIGLVSMGIIGALGYVSRLRRRRRT